MTSWEPPEKDKESTLANDEWVPPEKDKESTGISGISSGWEPPEKDDPDDPANIKDPLKLNALKQSGQSLSEDQERIVFDWEDAKPISKRASEFTAKAIPAAAVSVKDIAVGGAEFGYKGVLMPAQDILTGGLYYSPEERAKIWRDQQLSTKALASGGAQGLDEAIEAGTRMVSFGSAITDRIQGLPKEQRFRRYMSREMMRKFAQAARDETPDTLARLASESPLIRKMVTTIVGMQGGDPEAQKVAVEEYEKLVKESGMTKEELEEFSKVVNFGDVKMPTSIPGANTVTAAISKPLTAATRKAGEVTLKGLNLGSRATGWTAGKTIKGGEWIQQKSKDIGQYAVNDPDTFVKTATNTLLAPVMLIAKPTKSVADVITDITRQVDKGGAAGRKGMIQRAGDDIRSSELTRKLFGREGKGGVGRAKAADWAIRQSNAMIQPGVSSGTLNVLMGLPDAETAAQAGQQFGTGFGMGAYAGSRVESRVGGLIDPRTTAASKISNLVTPDPTQLRRDQDADIKRFMATASPELVEQMRDLSSVDKRKVAVDTRISELEDIQARTINPEDSKFIQDQIDGFKKQKEALDKATPETQREYDRLVQLTTLDITDQAKSVGLAAGLRGLNLVFLDPKNAEPFYRNLYGQNLIDAEKAMAVLKNKPFMTPDEENTLRMANETMSAFYQDVQNLENSRGTSVRESVTDPESPDFVPPHLRYLNQQGATAVVNMDLVKHLTRQGFNVRHTMQHEVQHALENFKEVQDLLSPLRKYLFDQKVKTADGGIEVTSKGIYDDEKIDAYTAKYAEKFSPQDGGVSFIAQFGGDIDKQRNYIKREILSEISAIAGEYRDGSRAVLDDVGRKAIDWLEVKTRDGYLKKLKEGLRTVGVVFDNGGGYSELLGAKITPEVLSAVREYQRGVRDINGALTYNQREEIDEPDIPITTILGNRALQEKYKEVAPFELEPVVKVTQPDGSISEIKVPEGANLDSFVGVYRIKDGKFIDEDGNEMVLAPEINISAMPDGTQFEINTRIARKPDGSPITISNREMKRRAVDRTKMIIDAVNSAPKDDSPYRMIDIGNGNYSGAMSPSQVEALRKIPNLILSPNLKRKIEFLNDILRRGDGTRVSMEYQASLLNGRYQALSPKLRDEVPIGFKITKDGNFTLTTMSVSRMHDKMNAWASKKPMRLQAWGGDTGKFWDSVIKYLDNHAQGKHGEEGLDPDPYISLRKKNAINDLFNVYNAETKAANPERTTLPRQKGKDPIDIIVRSRRLDRINDYSEMSAQKLPMNYGKLRDNYMPEINPLARPQSPEDMMENLDGSVTATRIRQAIASGNVEQLESELRMSDDLLPFESLYVSQGETGEPQIQVVSMFDPGIEPSVERSEIPTDIDAETEAEMSRLDAEYDMAEMGQQGQQEQQKGQQGQQGQQVPMARAEFIPPENDYLSQTSLDERKAKLPEYQLNKQIKSINGNEFDGFVELKDPKTGKQIGRADYSVFGGSLVVGFSFVNDKYLNQGYGEALYREIAKVAQENNIDNIVGETSPSARKVRNKLFQEQTQNWQDVEGRNGMVSLIRPDVQYMPQEPAVNQYGFYSRLEEGIRNANQQTFSPEQAKALAVKSTNQEELKWSGIQQAIENIAQENNGKVPKQALLDYMANEGKVKFEEVVIGYDKNAVYPSSWYAEKQKNGFWWVVDPEDMSSGSPSVRATGKTRTEAWDNALESYRRRRKEVPKYGEEGMNKVLPGGENYREVVLTMPEKETGTKQYNYDDIILTKGKSNWNFKTKDGVVSGSIPGGLYPEEIARDYALQMAQTSESTLRKPSGEKSIYTSSHFSNIPNYVAHIRINERKDAEGKEGLFIEEIQSDRHQQGRKKGYKGDQAIPDWEYGIYKDGIIHSRFKTKSDLDAYELEYGERLRAGFPESKFTVEKLKPEDQPNLDTRLDDRIPDAPFRKEWPLQMFKMALRDAVDSGKQWIGWTDGATQADRYDLSKQVESIVVDDLPYRIDSLPENQESYRMIRLEPKRSENIQSVIFGIDINGNIISGFGQNINLIPNAKNISDVVGKEMADKIINGEKSVVYKGNSLKIGGEGMKGYYDTRLPKEIGRYVDKMSGKVEKSSIDTGESNFPSWDKWHMQKYGQEVDATLDDETINSRYAEWEKLRDSPQTTPIWRVNITPEMQKSVRAGQPQYMPYVPYSMPKDPRQIMADFYLLTSVGDKASYFGKDWEKIKGMQMPTRTGLRYEKYGPNLEDAVKELTSGMKKHMLDSLLFSISAELRHYKSNRQPDQLLDNPFMKAYSEIYDAYNAVSDKNLPEYAQKYLKPMYPESPRARITKGSSQGYQLSNAAVRKALEETGTTIEDFSNIVEKLFRKGNWNSSYGGNPWGNIAEGLRMVNQANDTESLIKSIDNAYDLQHNTATVFNKIKKYQREGGYKWLQDMLDFKYHAASPRELTPMASSAAQKITTPALMDIGDNTIDKRRENAVSVIGEDVVSEIEKVMKALKPNRENIYQDINVKAPKGSGKDINAELQKWLVNSTASKELEKLGVNPDVIQYARLLLAQKMAPKRNVPQDIKDLVAESFKTEEKEYGPPIGIPEKSNLAKVSAPVKEGGNIIPADIVELKQQIHKLMHLHTESDIGTMVPYKGLVFSGMTNVPANTFTIKTYKDGVLIDEATFNRSSPAYDNSVYAYLYNITPVKEQTKAPALDKFIKWTPVYSPKGEYENFENGDKPIATQMTAYFDGKPLSAAFILNGDALHIKTEKGDDYSIPFPHESSADAKSGFLEQILGKYNDIVGNMKEYEDVEFSFIPKPPASLAQTKAPSSEPSLSPDLTPIAMTIEQLKQLIVNPKTGEISTQPLKILIKTELKYFPPNKIEGLTKWGNMYADWAKKAPAEELWPSVTGKPYENPDAIETVYSEEKAIADFKEYKKFQYDQWYANQSKKLKGVLPDEVVNTILDSAWTQQEKGSTLETPEKVLEKVKSKLGESYNSLMSALLSTGDINFLNNSINSAIKDAAKAMFSANPTSLEKIPKFMNSSQVLELAKAAKEGLAWDDTEGGESVSDNLGEFFGDLSDENVEELKKWYNSVLDYENEKKEFYGEKETDLEKFWPQSLEFMSPYEIDYTKKSITDAIAAGKNSQTWLDEFEMYGNKAKTAYSPDSQKELKKLFDEEAKKQKNTEIDPDVDYYINAINKYANFNWQELVSSEISGPQIAEDLIGRMFTKNFDGAFNRTISVGRKFLVPYSPAGDKIYILHGKDENIDGSVIFDMSKKTKEQTKQEMIDWVEHFIDYYDPKI